MLPLFGVLFCWMRNDFPQENCHTGVWNSFEVRVVQDTPPGTFARGEPGNGFSHGTLRRDFSGLLVGLAIHVASVFKDSSLMQLLDVDRDKSQSNQGADMTTPGTIPQGPSPPSPIPALNTVHADRSHSGSVAASMILQANAEATSEAEGQATTRQPITLVSGAEVVPEANIAVAAVNAQALIPVPTSSDRPSNTLVLSVIAAMIGLTAVLWFSSLPHYYFHKNQNGSRRSRHRKSGE